MDFSQLKQVMVASYYTRNGGFMLNDSNLLVNSEGHTIAGAPT